MGDMTIGIVLFVLIIAVGLLIGLRLSSTGPQRRAVMVAFAAMTVVAVLFYVVAMGASQLWTAPIFAVACIVVPIAAYTAMMRRYRPAKASVTRRSSNEAPRPVRTENRPRPARGSALDATVMPVAPNHPVNEYLSLAPDGQKEAFGGVDAVEAAAVVCGEEASDASETPGSSEVEEAASSAMPEEGPRGKDAAKADEAPKDEQPTGEMPAVSDGHPNSKPVEALIEEYLMEENEDEGGLFEPEVSPTLRPQKAPEPVTSTMMVTIPFAEGDERFLVVSESTSVPNPILAYKRTTSSHLVPIDGASAEHGVEVKAPSHAAKPPVPTQEPLAEKLEDFLSLRAEPLEEEKDVAEEQPTLFEALVEAEPEEEPQAEPAAAFEPETGLATGAREPVAPVAPVPARTSEQALEPALEEANRFAEFVAKADGLREKGLYPVAARLYEEAAAVAPTGAESRRVRFEEIACYVKAGQGEKARTLAAELRASSVLTRVERIKLDAIERMG